MADVLTACMTNEWQLSADSAHQQHKSKFSLTVSLTDQFQSPFWSHNISLHNFYRLPEQDSVTYRLDVLHTTQPTTSKGKA